MFGVLEQRKLGCGERNQDRTWVTSGGESLDRGLREHSGVMEIYILFRLVVTRICTLAQTHQTVPLRSVRLQYEISSFFFLILAIHIIFLIHW